jgi:hypothetical protein
MLPYGDTLQPPALGDLPSPISGGSGYRELVQRRRRPTLSMTLQLPLVAAHRIFRK